MKTYMAKPEGLARKWYLIDAEGKVLGRLASPIAKILRGKHRPTFTPHLDTGDGVIVINAEKIVVTGKKMKQKRYTRYSGYPSGLKEMRLEDLMKKKPTEVLIHAVRGMLPHNRLGRAMIKKLKVYAGADHPHQAQKPEVLEI